MYDLVINQKYKGQMQQEMFREVEKSKPKYILFVSCNFSWMDEQGQADTILKWINAYVQKYHYTPVGLVEYHFPEPSLYFWDHDVLTYQRKSNEYISPLRRPD